MISLVIVGFLTKQLENMKRLQALKIPTIELSDDERDDIDDYEQCGSHEDQVKDLHCEDCD